jgi:hypothetical protein
MDHIEKPKKRSRFAKRGEVDDKDAAALPSSTGREMSEAVETDSSINGAQRRSEVTGRHDAGSGANETLDGMTSAEEALRRGAEDTPVGAPEKELDDIPVFDRAEALPKV